ncbi:DUF4232 domain-containing protein [uncultured Friedmanniella sp.]|uniref:DUF4232 domain-containing protein n=1 Tax=uncultured Friedmanniella sp. TaxID=335381 RepID=UPI0035CB517E
MSTHRVVVRRAAPLLAAGLACGALVLTGCDNGLQTSATGAEATAAAPSTSPSPKPTAATSTPTSTSSKPPTAATTPTSGGSSAASRSAARCTVTDLSVGVRAAAGGAAAGSNYVLLTYRNTGADTCVLTGFPGVSFVGHGDGTQLGDPAVRNHANSASPVRLVAGATATSLLQIANAGNYSATDCAPTTADGFRVYPPGSRASVFVRFPASACQRSTAGSPQLSVSPVGTSG